MPVEQHGIIGDQDFGTELPQMQVDEDQLTEEKSMAKYAKSGEFQRIREHFNERIAFYQAYLPDGRTMQLSGLSMDELGRQWLAANTIVGELKFIMAQYDNAKETLDGPETS